MYLVSPLLFGGPHALDQNGHRLVLILLFLPTVRSVAAAVAPAAADPYLEIDLAHKLTIFGGHLSAFLLGWYLGNWKKRVSNGLLLGGAALTLAVIVWGTYHATVQEGSYTQSFLNQSAGLEILLASFVFLLFKQNFDRPSRLLQRIPVLPLSLSIYLMHNILLNMMYAVGFTVRTFPEIVAVTLLNFLICYVTMKTVATIKPLCYLATGMSYETACKSCNWIYTIKNRKK